MNEQATKKDRKKYAGKMNLTAKWLTDWRRRTNLLTKELKQYKEPANNVLSNVKRTLYSQTAKLKLYCKQTTKIL